MLKFLQTFDEALDLINELAEKPELSSFEVGLTGSYATYMNKKSSPIDIVLKLKEGMDETLIGSMEIVELIHNATKNLYSNKLQIIWLDLLEKDEEDMISYAQRHGMEANPISAYTNIVESIKWSDDHSGDSDDRISNSVMTWDEEEDNTGEVED